MAVLIYRDITERKLAEQELRKAHDELEAKVKERTQALSRANKELRLALEERKQTQALLLQSEKMASIGQLAAGVAHEINNPLSYIYSNLNTLSSYVRDLKQYLSTLEEARQAIHTEPDTPAEFLFEKVDRLRGEIHLDYLLSDLEKLVLQSVEGSERVRKIVQDLRTFTRADSGEIRAADVNSILDSALNIVWNELKYNCTVTKDYAQLPQIRCNANQLVQVFVNILVNAGQAIGKGRRGEIAIRTHGDGKVISVDIDDNGQGIPPANIVKVFDPFFTTKSDGEGTGLGLSISYNLVEKHGGRILVKSQVDVGTRFTVELPITAGESIRSDGNVTKK